MSKYYYFIPRHWVFVLSLRGTLQRSHYHDPNFPKAQELPQLESPPFSPFQAYLALGIWDG